jgi:hypothetical protein
MSIYRVALLDRHRNVGHWLTGAGRESDRRDRDHTGQCFHLVFFLLVGEPYEKEIPAPSYFAEVAAVSHGRVSQQTR